MKYCKQSNNKFVTNHKASLKFRRLSTSSALTLAILFRNALTVHSECICLRGYRPSRHVFKTLNEQNMLSNNIYSKSGFGVRWEVEFMKTFYMLQGQPELSVSGIVFQRCLEVLALSFSLHNSKLLEIENCFTYKRYHPYSKW